MMPTTIATEMSSEIDDTARVCMRTVCRVGANGEG